MGSVLGHGSALRAEENILVHQFKGDGVCNAADWQEYAPYPVEAQLLVLNLALKFGQRMRITRNVAR